MSAGRSVVYFVGQIRHFVSACSEHISGLVFQFVEESGSLVFSFGGFLGGLVFKVGNLVGGLVFEVCGLILQVSSPEKC